MQISALLWAHDRLPHVNMVNMGCKSAQSHPNLLSKNSYMFLNLNLLLGLIWEDVRLKHQMHVFMRYTWVCTKVRNDWDMGLTWLFRCTMHIMGTRGFGIGTQHALYMAWNGSWDTVLDELARGDGKNKDFQMYFWYIFAFSWVINIFVMWDSIKKASNILVRR